jgi:hypothetical protein
MSKGVHRKEEIASISTLVLGNFEITDVLVPKQLSYVI